MHIPGDKYQEQMANCEAGCLGDVILKSVLVNSRVAIELLIVCKTMAKRDAAISAPYTCSRVGTVVNLTDVWMFTFQ